MHGGSLHHIDHHLDQGFSVLIPTRGDAPRPNAALAAAIGSALTQPEAAEVLVVVDRAPEGPRLREGLRESLRAALPQGLASDPRLHLVERPPAERAHGPSATRNAGLRAARQDLIAFLDDDDAFLPGHLAAVREGFAAHPDAAIVATDALTFADPSGAAPLPDPAALRPWRGERAPRVLSYRELLLKNPVVTTSVALARWRIPFTVRFDESLPTMEDYDLWLRITRERGFVLLPGATVLVRRRPGSASRARRVMAECGLQMLERALRNAPPGQSLSAPERRHRLAGLHHDLAYACLADGDATAACRAALHAWRLHPLRLRSLAYAVASLAPGRSRSLIARRQGMGPTR